MHPNIKLDRDSSSYAIFKTSVKNSLDKIYSFYSIYLISALFLMIASFTGVFSMIGIAYLSNGTGFFSDMLSKVSSDRTLMTLGFFAYFMIIISIVVSLNSVAYVEIVRQKIFRLRGGIPGISLAFLKSVKFFPKIMLFTIILSIYLLIVGWIVFVLAMILQVFGIYGMIILAIIITIATLFFLLYSCFFTPIIVYRGLSVRDSYRYTIEIVKTNKYYLLKKILSMVIFVVLLLLVMMIIFFVTSFILAVITGLDVRYLFKYLMSQEEIKAEFGAILTSILYICNIFKGMSYAFCIAVFFNYVSYVFLIIERSEGVEYDFDH